MTCAEREQENMRIDSVTGSVLDKQAPIKSLQRPVRSPASKYVTSPQSLRDSYIEIG